MTTQTATESTGMSPRAQAALVRTGLSGSKRLTAAATILGVLEPFTREERIAVMNIVSAEIDGEVVKP